MEHDRPARIAVVDAHAIVRMGLVRLIEGESDLEIAGEGATVDEARELVRREGFDLLILGLNLDGADALELIGELSGNGEDTRLLAMSGYDEAVMAEPCLRRGASGYARKDAETEEVLRAVRTVLEGGIYVGERAKRRILSRLSESAASPTLDQLTDREIQVFRLLGEGHATREIADLLDLSPKTIESHRAKIMKKLNVENATQLLHRAIEWVQRERS